MVWASMCYGLFFIFVSIFHGHPCVQTRKKPFLSFCSQRHPRPVKWCDWKDSPTTIVGPMPSPGMVSMYQVLARLQDTIFFCDTPSFIPGELLNHFHKWRSIAPDGEADAILSFIRNGVETGWQKFYSLISETESHKRNCCPANLTSSPKTPAVSPVQLYRTLCKYKQCRFTWRQVFFSISPLASAARARFVTFLKLLGLSTLGLYTNETSHGGGIGRIAILLSLLGASKDEIANHVG